MQHVVTCDRKGLVLKRELRPGGEPIDFQPLAESLAKRIMERVCERSNCIPPTVNYAELKNN